MPPAIILKDERNVFIIGLPGGSKIIRYVAEAIFARLERGINVEAAEQFSMQSAFLEPMI